MTEPLLEYSHVDVSYSGMPVVHDVSFPCVEGEVVCIVGESGSGKSTLVKAAMGQLGDTGLVTRGDIWYGARVHSRHARRELRKLCGSDFALVFQDCLAALTPIRTIGDQVHESMAAHRPLDRATCDTLACEMFGKLGLDDPARVLASYPFNLSGGMGQRVGIAIALLSEPSVLFADEPTSALDVIVQAQVIELLQRINANLGTTIVLVTHNMGIVRALANHVLVLKDGRDGRVRRADDGARRARSFVHARAAGCRAASALETTEEGRRHDAAGPRGRGPAQGVQRKGHPDFTAVDGVSFSVMPGECVGLVGGSGCGKSTIAQMITRLLEPTSGTIRLNGRDVTHVRGAASCGAMAKDVQMVFQNPASSFDPRRTLGEGIAEGLRNSGMGKGEARTPPSSCSCDAACRRISSTAIRTRCRAANASVRPSPVRLRPTRRSSFATRPRARST